MGKIEVTTTRRVTTGIVSAVGLLSGGDSYVHIYGLAREHGQDVLSAALLPLAIDGVVMAASAVMLVAAMTGQPVPFRARLTFWAGVLATTAANGASGWPHGRTDALLSLCSPAAYLGAMEMLTWMHQHLGAHPKVQSKRPKAAPGTADAPEVPGAPDDELKVRRQRKTRQPMNVVLANAEKMFPGLKDGGKIPALRDLQKNLRIGQPYAQEVQKYYRDLREPAGLCSAGLAVCRSLSLQRLSGNT